MYCFRIMLPLLFLLLVPTVTNAKINSQPLVLLVAYDGLRFDFITPQLTPFLWNISQNGVFAPFGIQNQAYTVTAANFHSINTGLYEENSGVVGNVMWDPVFGEVWDIWNSTGNTTLYKNSLDAKWYTGTPIWQANDNAGNGRVSGAMRWPLCEIKANHLQMAHCIPWSGNFNLTVWKGEIDTLISWFTDPVKPINFGLYYNPDPDHHEHYNDIYSDTVKNNIKDLDTLAQYIFQRLSVEGLLERINIIFTADHGHSNVFADYNIVKLPIPRSNYIASGMSFFPRGISTDDLYAALKAQNDQNPRYLLYRKEEVPAEFHYKNNPRIGPIVAQPLSGYPIIAKVTDISKYPKVFGDHGFPREAPTMRPFFLATGPAFKRGYTLPLSAGVENIDIYALLCNLLNVKEPRNDGSLTRISTTLLHPPVPSSARSLPAFLLHLVLAALFNLFVL